jgi:hypothetical protein
MKSLPQLTKLSHDVIPQARFEKVFDRVYAHVEKTDTSSRVDPQEIALIFMVMAQGTLFSIEMPYNDPSAEEWLRLSERALVKGDFMSNNTVAGVQTLVHYDILPLSSLLTAVAPHGAFASVRGRITTLWHVTDMAVDI